MIDWFFVFPVTVQPLSSEIISFTLESIIIHTFKRLKGNINTLQHKGTHRSSIKQYYYYKYMLEIVNMWCYPLHLQAINMMIAVVLCFTLCWLPMHLLQLLITFNKEFIRWDAKRNDTGICAVVCIAIWIIIHISYDNIGSHLNKLYVHSCIYQKTT